MSYGALGVMQYDTGRGVFRRGSHGGGIFDQAISGLGNSLGQMTSEAVSWITSGGSGAPTSWGTDEAELAARAGGAPTALPPPPAPTPKPAAPKATAYTPVTTASAAAAPVMMPARAGMSDKTKAILIGGGLALAVVYYLHKKGKL